MGASMIVFTREGGDGGTKVLLKMQDAPTFGLCIGFGDQVVAVWGIGGEDLGAAVVAAMGGVAAPVVVVLHVGEEGVDDVVRVRVRTRLVVVIDLGGVLEQKVQGGLALHTDLDDVGGEERGDGVHPLLGRDRHLREADTGELLAGLEVGAQQRELLASRAPQDLERPFLGGGWLEGEGEGDQQVF